MWFVPLQWSDEDDMSLDGGAMIMSWRVGQTLKRVDRLRTVRVREVADLAHCRVWGSFRCNEARKSNKYDIGWWCNDSVMMSRAKVKESWSPAEFVKFLSLRGRHTVRFSRKKIVNCLANQSIVRVAGDTRVSETGHSYDIEFRICSKLLPMLSDERHD